MRTLTLEQFLEELKAQGVPKVDLAFRCVACGTIQSAADFIAAGAGQNFDEVVGYLGFSCVGRFTGRGSPPHPKIDGYQGGCNWSLGGLLRVHTLEVQTADGQRHPRFEPATPAEAQAHYVCRAAFSLPMS